MIQEKHSSRAPAGGGSTKKKRKKKNDMDRQKVENQTTTARMQGFTGGRSSDAVQKAELHAAH